MFRADISSRSVVVVAKLPFLKKFMALSSQDLGSWRASFCCGQLGIGNDGRRKFLQKFVVEHLLTFKTSREQSLITVHRSCRRIVVVVAESNIAKAIAITTS